MAAERMPKYITPEEYLLAEEAATTKSEYHNGVITAMTSSNLDHKKFTLDAGYLLWQQLDARRYEIFIGEQRVSVPRCNKYLYSDIVIACKELQFESVEGIRSLQNPLFIANVLSSSAADDDRTEKFACYMSLPSLQVYMFVSQKRPRAETYTRQPDGFWQPARFDGLEAVVPLPFLNCELPLSDVYERVTFPPPLQNTSNANGGDQA